MQKQTCNTCRSKKCHIWDRDKDGRTFRNNAKHIRRAVYAEKHGILACHEPARTKLWKFKDLISNVRISNVNNPALAMIAQHAR